MDLIKNIKKGNYNDLHVDNGPGGKGLFSTRGGALLDRANLDSTGAGVKGKTKVLFRMSLEVLREIKGRLSEVWKTISTRSMNPENKFQVYEVAREITERYARALRYDDRKGILYTYGTVPLRLALMVADF